MSDEICIDIGSVSTRPNVDDPLPLRPQILSLSLSLLCRLFALKGLGTPCFQMAQTTGCTARGIEILGDRVASSLQVKEILDQQHQAFIAKHNKVRIVCACYRVASLCALSNPRAMHVVQQEHQVGDVTLLQGRFEDPEHRAFIVECDLLICNNYAGVFGERVRVGSRGRMKKYVLNDFLIGILCGMKPGAALITFDKLKVLDQEAADELRQRRRLDESKTASFFKLKERHFKDDEESRGMLSFRNCNKSFTVYVYTRNNDKEATFLCNNQACENAKRSVPIRAWRVLDKEEDEEGKVVLNRCNLCKQSIDDFTRGHKEIDRLQYDTFK